MDASVLPLLSVCSVPFKCQLSVFIVTSSQHYRNIIVTSSQHKALTCGLSSAYRIETYFIFQPLIFNFIINKSVFISRILILHTRQSVVAVSTFLLFLIGYAPPCVLLGHVVM